jgi:hypothetical protein
MDATSSGMTSIAFVVVTICAAPAIWSASSADAENDARPPTQTGER